LATGSSAIVATGITDTAQSATEVAVFASGSLWITGRGLDLLRVNRRTGRIERTVETGPAGLNLAVSRGHLLVASYTKAGARRGDPIVGRLIALDPSSGQTIASNAATITIYLSGFAVVGRTMFVADTVTGRLMRLPLLAP
jgi:sugar lactone lactonase YvrE